MNAIHAHFSTSKLLLHTILLQLQFQRLAVRSCCIKFSLTERGLQGISTRSRFCKVPDIIRCNTIRCIWKNPATCFRCSVGNRQILSGIVPQLIPNPRIDCRRCFRWGICCKYRMRHRYHTHDCRQQCRL